jgi:hypothetical protein
VDESSEERESSDAIDYRQLLKDYREVQAFLASSRLKAEMLRDELDAARDALQVSKNEVSHVRAD